MDMMTLLQRRRQANWTDDEVRFFLHLYEDNLCYLKRTKRNKPVYDRLSASMQKAGFYRSSRELKKKMQNLSLRYRVEKTKMETTGNSQSEWRFFERLNQLIGSLPSQATSRTGEIFISNNVSTNQKEPIVELLCKVESVYDEENVETAESMNTNSICADENSFPQTLPIKCEKDEEFTTKSTLGLMEEFLNEFKASVTQHHEDNEKLFSIMKEQTKDNKQLISLIKEQNIILKMLLKK